MNPVAQGTPPAQEHPAPADGRIGLWPMLEAMTVDRVRRALCEALAPLEDELRETADRTFEREQRDFLLRASAAWAAQRASIESALPDRLARVLIAGGQPKAGGTRFAEVRRSWDELGLIDDGVIEDDLRFGEMVTRIRSDAGEELVAFDQRMGTLMGQPDLSGEANPFAPRHLIRALREAVAAASLDPRIKRRVMEALSRVVCPAMAELYRSLDALLRDRDVHPAAPRLRPAQPGAKRTPAPALAPAPSPEPAPGPALATADAGAPAEPPAQFPTTAPAAQADVPAPTMTPHAHARPSPALPSLEALNAAPEADPSRRASAALATGGLLGFLASLMPDVSMPGVMSGGLATPPVQTPSQGDARAAATPWPAPQTGVPAQPSAGVAQVGATEDLVRSLTSLQRVSAQIPTAPHPSGITAAEAPVGAAASVAALNVLHGLKTGPLQGQMGQMDLAILDVMALLFDQIFGDTRIPAAMKALIARLQIPALKVAVLDKTFFSRKSHPARRVLDLLGEIALGLGERFGPGEPLHDRIESILLDLMAQFEDDMSVFDRAAAELGEILRALNEQAEEQSRHHAARIQRSEELNGARRFAREALRLRLASHQAPRSIARFLTSEWNKLLVLASVHQGEDGPSVRNLLRTVDVLLWSLEPKRTVEARKRFVALLPTLLRQLSLGMDMAHTPPRIRQRVDAILLRYHTQAISPPRSGSEDRHGAGDMAPRERSPATTRARTEAEALTRLADEAFPSLFDVDPYAGMPEAEAVISSIPARDDTLPGDDAAPAPGNAAAGNAPRRTDSNGSSDQAAVEAGDGGIVWFTSGADNPGTAGSASIAGRAPRPDEEGSADEATHSGITWFIPTAGEPVFPPPSSDAGSDDASPAKDADPTAALQPGVWVEILNESGDPVQARLSIVSPHRSTFVFSDRAGSLVAEYSAYQVETYLRSGRLAVIPEAPLFERALGNLVGLLRRRAA
jgi:hypothetical protein